MLTTPISSRSQSIPLKTKTRGAFPLSPYPPLSSTPLPLPPAHRKTLSTAPLPAGVVLTRFFYRSRGDTFREPGLCIPCIKCITTFFHNLLCYNHFLPFFVITKSLSNMHKRPPPSFDRCPSTSNKS